MRITKVRIENYRSVKHTEFEPGMLCGLIGPNNAGKSNIIKAVGLVLGESWPSTRLIDEADFYAYSSDKDIVITVWFDEQGTIRGDVGKPVPFAGIQFRVTRYKRRSGNNEKGDLRSTFVCVDEDGEPVQILRRTTPNSRPHQQDAPVTSEIREALPAVVIDVDRNSRYHLSGSSRSILGRLLHDVTKKLKEDTALYRQFKQSFDKTRNILRTEEFNTLESKITEHLREQTGLSDVEVRLDGLDPINIYRNFSVLFKDADTPKLVDAERMGSGIQSAMVISVLQAYRELKRENAVLLFEEPELFLHPHGRRHLFRLLCELADNGVQVIYTTHNQDFVDLKRMESVRLVHKTLDEGTKVRAPNVSLVPEGWQKRIKHLQAPNNEAFFARSVILVEGATEAVAIRYLANIMNPLLDLDYRDCSILDVGGKPAIAIMIRIMAALGKKVLAVYDTDSNKTDPNNINTNQNHEIENAITGHGETFPCDPYFEVIAEMPHPVKNEKPDRMLKHLETFATWDEVPSKLKELMQSIDRISNGALSVRGSIGGEDESNGAVTSTSTCSADDNAREVDDSLSESEQEPNNSEVPF